MNGIIDQVIEFIDAEHLLQPNDRVLVAVSGGVDSVVLTYLLNELGYQIGIAHANFQLRASESEADEKFVTDIAHNLKVPVYTKKFDTELYARNAGISTQMAARALRYEWFEALRQQFGFHIIATAHHADDVVETVLLNFTRGTSIRGLHGILPKREHIIRPMLTVNKQSIIAFAKGHSIAWREDQSNQSDYYQRNLIRHQVIPILKRINPRLEATTRNTVEMLRSVEQHYRNSLDQLRQQIMISDQHHTKIFKSEVKDLSAVVLADLLIDFGFNLEQCKSVLKALGQSGKMFYSGRYMLNVDREEIVISPIYPESGLATIDGPEDLRHLGGHKWNLSVHSAGQYKINPDRWTGAFDLDLVAFPLKLRNWSAGDRFCPLGMRQHKKLSDFLIDTKVPVNYKQEVQVLLSQARIMWVVGHRIDDRFKITEDTTKVLEISIEQST
jgi:tRNA(Ile)-lysidine synthase